MQTTAIRTVANSLPEKGVILLTLLISDRYILFAELQNIFEKAACGRCFSACRPAAEPLFIRRIAKGRLLVCKRWPFAR